MAQQEAQLREVPRNKLLGMIADALSAASSPQRTQQMQGISQLLGIPALAKTANTLSYGGSLTSGKGMTTQMTPETKDALSVLLENIPIPSGKAAVAAGGVILPAMAAGAKRSEVKLAEQLIQAGKADEAYKQFRIYEDLTTGKMLKVVPDTNARFAPGTLDIAPYVGNRGPGMPLAATLPPSMYSAKKSLSDVIDHPELFSISPDTAGVQVGKSVGKGFGAFYPSTGNAAYLSPAYSPTGEIALGQTLGSTSAKGNPVLQMLSNILHETQHDIQYRYGLPKGGNMQQFFADYGRVQEAKKAIASLDKTKYATGWAEKVIKDLEDEAFKSYQHIPGEVQARLVQRQLETGDYTTHPHELMKAMGVDISRLQYPSSYVPPLDLNPTVENILDVYAPRGAKP